MTSFTLPATVNHTAVPNWYNRVPRPLTQAVKLLRKLKIAALSSVSLGRNRARKSHGNGFPEIRLGRTGDHGPDLPETRRHRAAARARERTDDLRAAGRLEAARRRRGSHAARGRSTAHQARRRASGGS